MSKAGLCGTHERMLAFDRLRRPERPQWRETAWLREGGLSGKGRGHEPQVVPALELVP